jgi:hypothetical protein
VKNRDSRLFFNRGLPVFLIKNMRLSLFFRLEFMPQEEENTPVLRGIVYNEVFV